MRSELGDAKYTMTLASNSLKKWQQFVKISSIWGNSLVKTMMHLFHRVFVRLNANVEARRRQKAEKEKFLHSRKRYSFDIMMRYSYSGKYRTLLKKNKNRVKNNNSITYEVLNIFHNLYRLSFFGDFRVSKQRSIYQKASIWRLLVKVSKTFVNRLNDMKRSKKRNIRRLKFFRSYLLMREMYKWKDITSIKKQRRRELLYMLKQFKKRYSLKWLHQYAHLKKLHRILTHKILKKRLVAWRVHQKSRIIGRRVVEKCLERVNVLLVKVLLTVLLILLLLLLLLLLSIFIIIISNVLIHGVMILSFKGWRKRSS